jgi:cytochrome c oxidase assembly protein subunit 11
MKQMKDHKRLTFILVCGVIFMFGFCYMLVPLYQLICKQEGINGKGANYAATIAPGMQIDYSRTIKVTFTTVLHQNLPFKFAPLQKHIYIHPGERKLIYFLAENHAGKEMTVQAVPSITPADAAKYLKKTECFCFTQQYFYKNEKADMPVYFFVEPNVPQGIKEITLAYTLFDVAGFIKKQEHYTKGRIEI